MKIEDIMAYADAYAASYAAMNGHEARNRLQDVITSAIEADRAMYDEAAALCAKLSPRQKEVLIYSSKGLGTTEIAKMFGTTYGVVQNYRTRIRQRIGVNSLIEATVVAAKAKII